ncbi:hypothetical protein PLESTB_001628700 [Pleodorina starrii]|uniref:Enkurin domain-containing protein n=1 Tax=Pleodorina starrii TaxID=330485 RepID=A0A9W6BZ85_9CHLO|nr:hypothetical protein PLESTM_000909800 [Pleodorina starrii]GLC60577.1 hypothetical protein PLESTB_001628700 [Pleodorina starrii]GLC77160.1 hypothetical protein PLESTF_001892700 [Pleodorina starrii]
MAGKPPRALSRPRSAKEGNESESIYALGKMAGAAHGAAPKVKVYNIAPEPPPTPGAGNPPTPKPSSGSGSGHRVNSAGDSSQIENLMNPVRGLRDAQARAGITPTNHARNNAMAVREQSQLNALRKAADVQEDSGSRLKLPPVRSTSAPTQRPLQRRPSSGGRDFVNENKLGAVASVRPPRPEKRDSAEKYLNKKDYGQVPQYLLERKMQMAADMEAAARAKEAALIPPGMRLMPEEERVETLELLKKNREEVERAIQALPLRIETLSAVRRKEELERRLKEIEDALKIFSRPKVLVHV